MKRKPPPQFELPQSESVFNLAIQSTVDGERLRREADAAAKAKAIAAQQQPTLFNNPINPQ